ncbi:MAG: peptidoglycan-associated lipoprotein Pal [Alphaproteobacteria bacterium]|nr:MAG: peptidoglycan-associated lipoprotein Pal [Alphaproteobacteria bacterium]
MKLMKLVMVAATALGVAACSSPPPAEEPAAPTISEGSVQYFNSVVGDRVLFAYDSSALSDEAQEILTRQAQWLNAYPNVTAVIEGHADERGTREYNIALGARRANATRAFLIAQGVDGARLRTVSYGKERPVMTCPSESCWSQNRRTVTVVEGAPTS